MWVLTVLSLQLAFPACSQNDAARWFGLPSSPQPCPGVLEYGLEPATLLVKSGQR
jgi:hypothetical protein